MARTKARRNGHERWYKAFCVLLGLQFAAGPFCLLVAALPVETQDSATEIVTTRLMFDGADGSLYLATRVGPSGAQLGSVTKSIVVGQGAWGAGSLFDRVRMVYPGNLTLGAASEANEVFFNRLALSARDMDAAGTFVWNTGTTNSVVVGTFDADGDGVLDDVFLADNSNLNRITTWNEAGTQIGTRRLGSNLALNAAIPIDANGDGKLEQLAVAHDGGRVYLEPANIAADVWVYNLPGAGSFTARMLAAADFDNDSFLENVVVGSEDNGVYALSPAGAQIWVYNTGGASLVDIASYWPSGAPASNGVLVAAADAVTAVDRNGLPMWNYTTNATVTAVAAVDLDGDRLNDDAVYGDDQGGITLLNEAGQLVGYSNILVGPVRDIAAADLSGAGLLSNFVAVNSTSLVGLDAALGLRWTFAIPSGATANALAPADLDGNGQLGDTILGTSTTVFAVNSTGAQRWLYSGPYNTTSVAFIENPRFALGGNYETPPIDAGTSADWADLTANFTVNSPNETLAASVRFGSGSPGNISWGPWAGPAAPTAWNLSGNNSRFIQVRYTFNSTDAVNTANLAWLRVNYTSPALTGFVETPDFVPPSPAQWVDFAAQDNQTGGPVRYFYSSNAGASWHAVTSGGAIDAANLSAAALRIRAEMDAGSGTPTVSSVALRYAQPGLRPAIATPAAGATITGTFNITALANAAVTGVSFSWVNTTTNATVALGPAAFDAGSSRWWLLWNTTGLEGPGFALVARGTDARGFAFTSSRLDFAIDNTAPTVAIQAPAANDVLSGTVTLQASASLDAVAVQFSYFDGVSFNPIGPAVQTSPGQWELAWDTSAISELEGARLYASATDGVGLVGAQNFSVVVDNLPPSLTVTAPVAAAEVSGLVNVTVDASLDVLAVQIFYNGTSKGNATAVAPNATVSHWIVSWDTSQIYYYAGANLTVVARDRAGHTTSIVAGPFTINNTQPVPDLVAPLPGSYNTGLVYVAATSPLGTATIEFSYQDRTAALPTVFRTMTAAERNFTTGLWEFTWDTTSPKVDFNGSIILKATSGLGVSGTRSFLNIVVDNTPPTLRFVNPAVGESRLSGTPLIDVQTSSDVVSVDLSYTNVSSGQTVVVGAFVPLSPFEWALTWDLTNVFVPSATLRAAAVDHVGLKAWANFSFVVLGVNPSDAPPTITRAPSDIILDEDFGTYTLDVSPLVTDDDMGNLSTYVDGVDANVVTLRNNGSKGLLPIYFVSVQDAHSTVQQQLRLRFVDSSGQADSALFNFFVQPRNDAPYWSAPPEVVPPSVIFVHFDEPYELDFAAYAHDVEHEKEGTPLYVTASDTDHIVQNLTATTSLIFTYPQSLVSQAFDVTISLSDGDQALVPPTIVVNVHVTTDWVPQLSRPLPPIFLVEDTPRYGVIDLDDYFVDRDNEAIYYYRGNTNLSFEIVDGSVSVTALPQDWSGTQTVFFGASDITGAFSEARITFVVAPVNDAPRWNFLSGLDVSKFFVHFDEDYAFDLLPYVVDVDTPTANLTLQSSNPAQAHAAPGQPLRLVLNYGEALNGTTQPLVLWVSDGEDRSVDAFFNVSVSSNYPPALVQPLPLEIVVTEDQAPLDVLDLSNYFVDPDGVLFFYNGTVHVNVSIVNGHLSVYSNEEWGGTETLIIRAVDNEGSFQQATILVTIITIDDKPRLKGIPDLELNAGEASGPINLFSVAVDPDTPPERLVFSARSTYNGAFISIVNGTLRLVYPRYDGANTFDPLQVCVSDGNSTTCRTVSVRINQVTVRPFDWLGLIIVSGAAGIAAIVGARHFIEFKIKRAPTVEDIFLVYEDGILIKHYSKKMRKFADDDVVTSMLSAIQSFAADSFEDTSNWELREITFQGRKILIEKARKFQIYIIFDGDSNEDLKKAIKRSADAIGREYAKALRDWDGDPSHFDGAEKHFKDLLSMEAAFIPEGVRADELVMAPLVPGNAYLSETGNFDPIIKAYGPQLKEFAAVRIRPAPDAGSSIEPLKPDENIIVEVPAPEGVPGEEENGETGLDTTLKAVREAVDEARVAVRGRTPAIFFEGFGFIVDRYGFVFSKKFADQLKRIASSEGCYLFIAVDPGEIDAHQLEGLERDGVVFRGD